MVPTVRDGDIALVRRGVSIRAGDVVLARFRSMPERAVVKRAARAVDGGWWLRSDNRFAPGDSTQHGVADVLGRVVLRWSPGSPRPRRIAEVAPGRPDVSEGADPAGTA
jgi:phage repressor protein C with HTH and peptisase S24 domain